MAEWIDKKMLGTLLIVIVVAISLFYGIPYLQQAYYKKPPVEYKYTTGLTAKIRFVNGTSGAAVTSGLYGQVFAAGVNPLAYGFLGSPVYTAVYDSVSGAWVIGGISAGSYVLLVTESSAVTTMHPVKAALTIPGTDEEKREVWANPATVTIFNIADVTFVDYDVANLTTTKGAVSKLHLTYDGTNEGINGSDAGGSSGYNQGDYWRITYDISISAGITQQERIEGPIRLYWTKLTEQFTFDQVLIDGVVYTLTEDASAADDGYSGLYTEVTGPWKSGESHSVQLFLTQYSGEAADATGHTLTLTVVAQFGALCKTYRTWTDTSQAVPCKDV